MVKDRLKELHETRKKLNLSIPTFNEDVVVQVDDGHNGALLILLDKIGPLYARVKVSLYFIPKVIFLILY